MTNPKRRRIKRGKITHISLCRRGMNQMPVLMKSGDRVQIELLTKATEGLLYALVYVPEENGDAAIDYEGDVAPAAVIKQMAHDFLSNVAEVGGGIDIEHDLQVLGPDKVKLAETFIVQKGDERFAGWKDLRGNPVNATGSWAIILKMVDAELRAAAERGELNGVSMFGNAQVEILSKNTPNPNTNTNTTMNEEQMQKLAEMLTKSLATALTPTKKEEPKAETIPFEGDPLSSEDLAKHMDKILFASLDLSKPSDLAKWQGHVAKRQAELKKSTETADDQLKAAQAELAKAQEKIAKLTKTSGAPVNETSGDGNVERVGLNKSESDQWKAGVAAVRALGIGKSKAGK